MSYCPFQTIEVRSSPEMIRFMARMRMVPTVQPPPPPVESSNSASDTKVSLDDTVHKLHDLVFAIALPKTKTAKMAVINIEVLHLACNLAESACALLQEHWKGPQLDDISRQLEVIKAHLDIPSAAQSPQKLSYAATVATGTQSPSPAVSAAPPHILSLQGDSISQ